MAYAALAMAGLQLAGGYFASQNIKEVAKLNKEISDMNAEFADLDAHDAELDGLSARASYQSVIDQTLGKQQAELTAAGVDVTYGSAADIQKETRFIAELNKMEVVKQAQEQSLGFKRQARNIRLGGFLNEQQAKGQAADVMFNSAAGAASTGLSGYGQYAKGQAKSGNNRQALEDEAFANDDNFSIA